LAEGVRFPGKVYWPLEAISREYSKVHFFPPNIINGVMGFLYYKFIINAHKKSISVLVQPNTWQQVTRGREKAEGLGD